MRIYFTLVSALLLSCGENSSDNASLQDISVPGNHGVSNSVLWLEDNTIFIGGCPENQLPSRLRCSIENEIDAENTLYQTVRQISENLISKQEALREKIKELKNNHPDVKPLLVSLQNLQSDQELKEENRSSVLREIESLEGQLLKKNEILTDYTSQIELIKSALEEGNTDPSLSQLLTVLIGERRALLVEVSSLEAMISEKHSIANSLTDEIEDLQININLSSDDYIAMYQTVTVSDSQSEALEEEISDTKDQLVQLEILKDQLRSQISFRYYMLTPYIRSVIDEIIRGTRPVNIRNSNGYLELFHNDEWRGVCDDSFNEAAANVACKSMGYNRSTSFRTVQGPNSFWLDDLICIGNESSLFDCGHAPIGSDDCGSAENVQVECS